MPLTYALQRNRKNAEESNGEPSPDTTLARITSEALLHHIANGNHGFFLNLTVPPHTVREMSLSYPHVSSLK